MKSRKIMIVLMALMAVTCLMGCGSSDTSKIKDSEIDELYTSPSDFKGRAFDFTAKVLQVEKDGDMLYIQAFYDKKNYDKNTVITYDKTSLSVKEDDYIKVEGIVKGDFKGENAFGGDVTAPLITAKSVKKIAAADAYPANKTVKVGTSITKGGCTATISKVDYTDDGTRVYLTIKNSGSGVFTTYTDQTVVVQDGKQYEANYNDEYEQMSTDIKSGASTEGIVCFDKLDKKEFTVSFTGYDADYNEYTFDFSINVK